MMYGNHIQNIWVSNIAAFVRDGQWIDSEVKFVQHTPKANVGNRNNIRFYETTLTHRMPRHKRLQRKILFGRRHKTRLPQLPTESTSDDDVRNKDNEAKQKMKTYADR